MQAISLWQPWASLIAFGEKEWETRSWHPPTHVIGQRIAIHAAKKWTWELIDDCSHPIISLALKNHGVELPTTYGRTIPRILPLGVIVATAVLAEARKAGSLLSGGIITDKEYSFGYYAIGRYAWRFTDVQALKEPIPFVGKQGFFEIPNHVFADNGS